LGPEDTITKGLFLLLLFHLCNYLIDTSMSKFFAGFEDIPVEYIAEAISYRKLDRKL